MSFSSARSRQLRTSAAPPAAAHGVGGESAPTPADVVPVMLVAAVCGVYFGLMSGWQIAVESAQVVAGTVSYPADNPFYMYHIQSWTLLHQVPALLLKCGWSEQVVSLAVGCVAAVLSFEALAMCALAFSRDRFLASLVPLICYATCVCKECGAVYPIRLTSNCYWNTYGVTGTAYMLFAWSLLGLGFRRGPALLCGLAPAVHPALGTWCVCLAGAGLAWKWRDERNHAPSMARWFAAGAACTLASFLVQRHLARGLPSPDPALVEKLLVAFVAEWDNHRFPYPLDHAEWRIGWCALALFSVVYAWQRARVPREAVVLLRIALLSTSVALPLCLATHRIDWLPQTLVMAMPGRFINLTSLIFPAVLVALLARFQRTWPIQGLFGGLMLFCLLRTLTLLENLVYVPHATKVFVVSGLILIYCLSVPAGPGRATLPKLVRAGALAALALAAWLWAKDWQLGVLIAVASAVLWIARRRLDLPAWPSLGQCLRGLAVVSLAAAAVVALGPWLALGAAAAAACAVLYLAGRPRPGGLRGTGPAKLLERRGTAAILGVCGVGLIGVQLAARVNEGCQIFRHWEADPLYSAARRSSGLILTGPRMGIIQLRTRRGVLLNGEAMNQITYVPASGPAINRVVQRIFGDDILQPRPAGWQKLGGLMFTSGRELWQEREPDEWRRLAGEFGFTNIVTYADWRLKLPEVARNREFVLYEVPSPVPATLANREFDMAVNDADR